MENWKTTNQPSNKQRVKLVDRNDLLITLSFTNKEHYKYKRSAV